MSRLLLHSFWALALVGFLAACQGESKSPEVQTTETKPEPVLVLPEDYSAGLMEISRKDYDPLAQKILANHEVLKSKLSQLQTGRVARTTAEGLIQRQHKIENAFSDAMKNFVYLENKLAAKEITKAQYLQEKQMNLDGLKKLQDLVGNMDVMLTGNYIDSLLAKERTIESGTK